uniref:Uncharacterized protein n=1 Tax=Fagus sylvatica TaxID=28930 RepID=A0A2N9FTV0_FAGSY
MNNHLSFPHIKHAADDATPQETDRNTMWCVIQIGAGIFSVIPFVAQQTGGHDVARGSNTVRAHGAHALDGLIPPPTGESSAIRGQVNILMEPQENGALASRELDLNVPAAPETFSNLI